MTRKRHLPKYVSAFLDRHGKEHLRFRRKGFTSYYFREKLGSDGFRAEYRACMDGQTAIPLVPGIATAAKGSFDELLPLYYRTPDWLSVSDATRLNRRRVLERFRAEHGDKPVAALEPAHIIAILGKMSSTPNAANMLRKQLLRLMDFAVVAKYRTDNPVRSTKPYKIRTDGYHTWTEDEIAQFEARHAVGTKARLALDLMLWTGQRRSDAVRMGRQHVKGGRLVFRQQKTTTRLSLPILPPLQRSIDATETGDLTFLVTSFGLPFTPAGFGNWFRDRCNEAGLPQCSAHGLRKAAARRLAEGGATNQAIKAWTGHKNDAEVALYTRDADQVTLSDAAAGQMMAGGMSNREPGKCLTFGKPLKDNE